MSTNYNQQAEDFLTKTGTTLKIVFLKNDYHFQGDETTRDIYECTLTRGARSYTFTFGQSINDSQKYQDRLNKAEFYTPSGYNAGGRLKHNEPERLKDGYMFDLIPGKAPRAYSILAATTKYNPGTLEDFCSEYGYDTDSKKAERTYNAVKDEYMNLCMLFTDEEMEMLAEIQ